jgi:hypothetical protein
MWSAKGYNPNLEKKPGISQSRMEIATLCREFAARTSHLGERDDEFGGRQNDEDEIDIYFPTTQYIVAWKYIPVPEHQSDDIESYFRAIRVTALKALRALESPASIRNRSKDLVRRCAVRVTVDS